MYHRSSQSYLGKKDLYIQLRFPLNIKSINPTQKYRHITEWYACILKMLVLMFLLLIKKQQKIEKTTLNLGSF